MASCAMLFSFSSCEGLMNNDDDETGGSPNYSYTDVKVTETDNSVVFSYKLTAPEWSYNYKIEWKFTNDKCTSCTVTYVCPSAEIAALVKESFEPAERAKVTVNGNTLTYDSTQEYEEMTKAQILLTAQYMEDGARPQNQA